MRKRLGKGAFHVDLIEDAVGTVYLDFGAFVALVSAARTELGPVKSNERCLLTFDEALQWGVRHLVWGSGTYRQVRWPPGVHYGRASNADLKRAYAQPPRAPSNNYR